MKTILIVCPKKREDEFFIKFSKFILRESFNYMIDYDSKNVTLYTHEFSAIVRFISKPEYARGTNYDLIYDLQGTTTPWGTVTQGLNNYNILSATILANKGKMKVFHV